MSNLAIIGMQWGDEGKGKLVDLLAPRFEVVARFQGGHNAGHTVQKQGRSVALHLLPTGILAPGCHCVIGNGVVVDPQALKAELEAVREWGVDPDGRLFLSDRAHVITPWHTLIESHSEERRGAMEIGTTRRGIGPTYSLKADRLGLRVADLLNREILARKLGPIQESSERRIGRPAEPAREELEALLLEAGETFRPFVTDTSVWLARAFREGSQVLFEGAQGTMLDLDHGTYPFVTSSSACAGGISTGLGIGPREIHAVLGVVKAYATRVGAGPMPTELKDANGSLLRERGREYGATTGRPRRCGWFDAVAARYSARVNGVDMVAVTLLDVLDAFEEIQLATAYRYKGSRLTDLPADLEALERLEPVYESMRGWKCSLREYRNKDELPVAAKDYLSRLEEVMEAPVAIVSVGPEPEQSMIDEKLLTRWPAAPQV